MINDPQTALNAISGKPVRPDVVQGLKAASEKTGVSFDFLVAEATRESGLNPNAKAPTTSARGLFQFTSQTWLEVFKANGAKYGQSDLAKKIKRGEDGTLEVADGQTRKTILGLRQDPEMSALMAAEYAVANEKRLESRLGREVGPSDLYLAHFLGPNGAARFIDASAKSPDQAAAKLMPAAARHNHSVFFEGSRPRTVAAVYGQVK
ncbi:MAG: transglycosylase SLT domain-containing protein, partial [Rhodospirillales bacterium]